MVYFTENNLIQESPTGTKIWSIPELLETPNPLPDLPLFDRNAALRKAAEMANKNVDALSKTALLQLDFWKYFQPAKILECTYIYPSATNSTHRWELTINKLGLFYTDISGEYYYPPGHVFEQLFSDFWFYGPLQPIPELSMREKIVGLIRDAFLSPDGRAAGAHFELFEYPELDDSSLFWEEGDHNRKDFVAVRSNGIELGYSTWRDPQPMVWFISFERFLHEPPHPNTRFTAEIRAKIEHFLDRKSGFNRSSKEEAPEPPQPPTPREKMDLAETMLKADSNSEKGAEVLISLLEYDAEESYWRNYVFSYCFKLRGNKKVGNFILKCLQGDIEIHFKKAVDVLQMWGFYGDKSLQDRALLLQLNWEDATANDPEFRGALEKIVRIVRK
ncbi:MAG: hypothetical protein ACKVU0_14995 [Saprospiraceae bacterium]